MPVRSSKNNGLEAIPTIPIFFDKTRLKSGGEFDKYIYEIVFKKSGKSARGMAVGGYIHAMRPYLKSIKSEILHYGLVSEKRPILSCVVKCTVTISYKLDEDGDPINITFEGIGDGDVQDVPTSGSLVRTVETRALNRALERASGISKSDLNNKFVGEDEYGSAATMEIDDEPRRRKSPQELKAEREKKYTDDGDELDDNQTLDDGNVSDIKGETASDSEEKEIDW
jgi:hypothetical protein